MARVLSLLLLICAIGCSDSHSGPRPVVTDADGGETTPSDAGSVDNPPPGVLPVTPKPDFTPPNFQTSCERDGRHYTLGERTFDRAACSSLQCTRSGWNGQPAFCNEGTQCDGGPCAECTLGSQRFPLGAGLICEDGCNLCTCTGLGKWVQTIAACDALPGIEACSQPPADDATRALYLAGGGNVLALRAEFELGGCAYAELKACYALESNGGEPARARIWLEPHAPLAACTIPFVGEAVFSLKALREQDPREHGAIELQIGAESIAYEF